MKVGDRVKLKSTNSWAEQLFEDALIFSWGFCCGAVFAFFLPVLAH